MVVHLPSAAHHVADLGIVPAVTCSAGDGITLKKMDIFPGHLCIAHQEATRRERRQAGADEIGGFIIYTFMFLGTGESFIDNM